MCHLAHQQSTCSNPATLRSAGTVAPSTSSEYEEAEPLLVDSLQPERENIGESSNESARKIRIRIGVDLVGQRKLRSLRVDACTAQGYKKDGLLAISYQLIRDGKWPGKYLFK